MIEQNRRVKIVTGWIKDSPEFKSLLVHREVLVKLLTSCCFSLLTEEEKLYYDTYGVKYVKRQLPFCVNEYLRYRDKEFKGEALCKNSMWVSPSEYKVVFSGIPELNEVNRIEFDSSCPFLANFTDSSEITGIPKRMDDEIYEATKAYYNDAKELDRKMKALIDVVFAKDATLREIKKVYPRLYEYSL